MLDFTYYPIRHAGKEVDINQKYLRIYKIISGSFSCVRNGEMGEYSPNSDYVVVKDFDIFSFKAGDNGCIFAIFDFPEFNPTLDTNDIFR